MLKKVIVFGNTSFSEVLSFFLNQSKEFNICGYTVEQAYRNTDKFNGLPLVDFENIEFFFPPETYSIFICLGYTNMNRLRENIFYKAKEKGYRIESYIHPSAIVNSALGEGCVVMEGAIIGAFCTIGHGNVFWAAAHLAHHNTVGNFNFFTISVAIAGHNIIGNNCFFGNNCTIFNSIKIEDDVLVGAGACLKMNAHKGEVYVPARSILLEEKPSTDIQFR